MPNQPKELQKTENEKVDLEQVSENSSFDVSLKILAGGGAVVTILTGVVKLFGFIYLPLDVIGMLGALVFVLAGLTLYFVSLRPRNKRLIDENKSLKAEMEIPLSKNPEFIGVIENLNEEHQREIETLEQTHKEQIYGHRARISEDKREAETQIAERETKLRANQWLIDLAETQRKNIDDYIELELFCFCRIATETVPTAIFAIQVRNKSIFDVELENKIDGEIHFYLLELEGNKRFNPQTTRTISTSSRQEMTLEVKLTKEDLEYIDITLKDFNKTPQQITFEQMLEIDKLEFIIKGANDDLGIEPKQLKIKTYPGKRFKVVNCDKYRQEIEKFSQY